MKSTSKNKKNNQFNLKLYSSAALAYLLLKSGIVYADVAYYEIDPDTVLHDDGDVYKFDLNHDGTKDFEFKIKYNFGGGYFTSGGIYFIPFFNYRKIQLYNLNMDMASIVASIITSGTSFSYINRFLPEALPYSNIIDLHAEFQYVFNQSLAFQYIIYSWSASYYAGNWFPEMLDHYIGVRVKDAVNDWHYGWIRCDVKDEGRTLVIKDYAYETEPDRPIRAGDTVSYVGIQDIHNTLNASVYSFNSSIHIHLPEPGAQVQILNLNGEKLIEQTMDKTDAEIDMRQYPAGLYLVELTEGEKKFSKKVVIE